MQTIVSLLLMLAAKEEFPMVEY
nr:unnamed protein product [Callosobruchus analis]